MHCGENEYERCKAALHKQTFRDFDVFEVTDLPNKLAHETLYRTFEADAGNYEMFLKLDADMVFNGDVLGEMVDLMTGRDHALIDVYDWPSGLMIAGIHLFSNQCRWAENNDIYAVDTHPTFPGKGVRVRDRKYVLHNPDPSDYQSFRYGAHKGVKAIQPEVSSKNFGRALHHITILKNIWRRVMDDERRILMMLGAEAVFGGLIRDYSGRESVDVFKSFDTPRQYLQALSVNWSNEMVVNDRWLNFLRTDDGV